MQISWSRRVSWDSGSPGLDADIPAADARTGCQQIRLQAILLIRFVVARLSAKQIGRSLNGRFRFD